MLYSVYVQFCAFYGHFVLGQEGGFAAAVVSLLARDRLLFRLVGLI